MSHFHQITDWVTYVVSWRVVTCRALSFYIVIKRFSVHCCCFNMYKSGTLDGGFVDLDVLRTQARERVALMIDCVRRSSPTPAQMAMIVDSSFSAALSLVSGSDLPTYLGYVLAIQNLLCFLVLILVALSLVLVEFSYLQASVWILFGEESPLNFCDAHDGCSMRFGTLLPCW